MKDDLKKFARSNGERARVKASRVALMLRLYGRDPEGSDYLRQEAEHLARKVVYHLRQAVIAGSLIERIDGKKR